MNASQRLLNGCRSSDSECVEKALDDGADVNFVDPATEWFPLRVACWHHERLDIVKMVLAAGADVNHQDSRGDAVIHWAVMSPVLLNLILMHGGNPNLSNRIGNTPCHYARTPQALELLISFGADLRMVNKGKNTPFQNIEIFTPARIEKLRPVYESWTPHKLLRRWKLTKENFNRYAEECTGFRNAILTSLLCFLRYRNMIPKEVGFQIIENVAEMHRKEMWWPSWKHFNMRNYM